MNVHELQRARAACDLRLNERRPGGDRSRPMKVERRCQDRAVRVLLCVWLPSPTRALRGRCFVPCRHLRRQTVPHGGHRLVSCRSDFNTRLATRFS
ncbi:MAG: hypothetical protein C4334_14275 [Pyrinomonas sp.]